VLETVEALEVKDFAKVGQLLNASHNSLKEDYNVSCPELDLAVDAANATGALGARMVGGGFGGSAIALLKREDIEKAKERVNKAFAINGFKAPRFFVSLPSQGAQIAS
jgi:galactokinase